MRSRLEPPRRLPAKAMPGELQRLRPRLSRAKLAPPLPRPRAGNRVATALLSAVLALAPLPFGSIDQVSLAFWCVLLGLNLVIVSPRRLGAKRAGALVLIGALAASVVVVSILQGTGANPLVEADPIWAQTARILGPLAGAGSVALWVPLFAMGNLLACMAAMAIGLIVGVDHRNTRRILVTVAISGVCYAIYGIVFAFVTPDMVLWERRPGYFGNVIGTFLQRNTAAVYFGSCACLWLAMTCRHLRDVELGALWAGGRSGRVVSAPLLRLILLVVCTLTCTAALLMTSSRAGVLLSVVALSAVAVISLWDMKSPHLRRIPLKAGLLVAVFCLIPLLGGTTALRFGQIGFSDENRLDVYRSTLRMIMDRPWFGSGLGTFPLVFPSYRDVPPSLWGVWIRAHSTPLELMAELGIPLAGAIIVACLAALIALAVGVRATRGREAAPLAAAAALVITMVHSCIDFSLQIPGCAIVVTGLVGLGLARSLRSASPRSLSDSLRDCSWNDVAIAQSEGTDRTTDLGLHARFGNSMPLERSVIDEMLDLLERTTVLATTEQQDEIVQGLLAGDRTQIVSFINQHAFNLAYEDQSFRVALEEADCLLRDGVGIEVALKLLGLQTGINANGTDFIPRLLAGAGERKVAIFGTREPWLGTALLQMRKAGIVVVASLDGFRSRTDYVEAVRRSDPDIVILAMGMPRQEVVANELRACSERPRLIVNGGAILDFYAERFRRAPLRMRQLRLEWLFRLAQEPRRLARRYLLGGTKFTWRIVLVMIAARLRPLTKRPQRPGSTADRRGSKIAGLEALSSGIIIVSPGGQTGRGGMASVTRTMADWIEAAGDLDVFVVDARGRGSSWLWPFYFCKAAAKIAWLGLRRKASILHLQVSERNSFIRKGLLQDLGRALGMIVLLHHHGAELIPFYRSTNRAMRWWTRRTVLRADYNVVLGERWNTFLCDEVGASVDRVGVLYNGSVDLGPSVAALGVRPTRPAGTLHVLVMANLSPRKGIGEFLATVKRLRDEGIAISATLAGGGEVERYIAEAKVLGLSEICHFTGWIERDKVSSLFAKADCLALPSYEEGLPIAILEALTCRVPIVATPVGSIGEVLSDNIDCLLVPPGDVDALTDALRRLARDPALRVSLAENGRALFERLFSVDTLMKALFQRYQWMLRSKAV